MYIPSLFRCAASVLMFLTVCSSTQANDIVEKIAKPTADVSSLETSAVVVIGPEGDDSWPGTPLQPKRSFSAALAALPWIDGAHVSASVHVRPGIYRERFVVGPQDVRRQTASRSISIVGAGSEATIIDCSALSWQGAQGAIDVTGQSCVISGITVRRSPGVGLRIAPHSSNVTVRDVSIDTCQSHGLYAVNADTVRFTNCRVVESCRADYDKEDRSWGSAVKFLSTTHTTVDSTIVYDNWGEGINVNRGTHADIHDNIVGNNFSGNIYIDMGAVVVVRNNIVHADPSDSSHWRFPTTTSGISMNNEHHCAFDDECPTATWTGTADCRFRCTGLGCEFIVRMNDSILVANNIIVNSSRPLGIFQLFNIDCVRNIWFEHNTVYGSSGTPRDRLLSILLPQLLKDVVNLRVVNNLFLTDNLGSSLGTNGCMFEDNVLSPALSAIVRSGNVWNVAPSCPLTSPTDSIIPVVRGSVRLGPTSYSAAMAELERFIHPEQEPRILVHVPASPNCQTDIRGFRRGERTAAGAIEGPRQTSILRENSPGEFFWEDGIHSPGESTSDSDIRMFDVLGRECQIRSGERTIGPVFILRRTVDGRFRYVGIHVDSE